MPEQIPFIGRQDEIALIENLIEEWGTRRVLCINGLGGIGKTRLLQEVHKQYTSNQDSSLLVADILDFDDRALQVPANLERKIAQGLDEKAFEPYLRELLDWRKMERVGVSQQGLEKQSQRVHRMFIDNFNKLSKSYRFIVLLDTTEKLEEEIRERLISLMEAAQNTIFLLAGRNAKELWTRLRYSEIGHDALLIDLPPFAEKVGQQYLEQKESLLYITLDAELKKKLLLLSGGRPILLDLAVEWLSRDLPLDWMTTHSLEELKSLSVIGHKKHENEFEVELVRHIAKIRTLMDRLTLVMSWIYPITPAMIVKLLNITEYNAIKLFCESKTYIFVKCLPNGQISLHDEMRRMVNEYVWPEVDPQGGRRRQYSKIANSIFQEEDNRLKERIREKSRVDLGGLFENEALARDRDIINQQWIEHALYSDAESGFEVWKRIIDERRREKEFRFANGLLELGLPYYNQFSPDQQFEFDMLRAWLGSDTGQVREAKKFLDELLVKNNNRQERKANIYNALGIVEAKLGQLREALEHQLECLNIVQQINVQFISPVANVVGYIHRQLGELTEAEKYYRLALNSTNKSNKRLIASLLNNLGYVYGLQIKYRQMEFYCRQAIQIWAKIGADREIGRAENTMAIFSRVQGDYDEAITLLERAISRYEELDDHEKLTRAYLDLGWTQWYKAEKVDKEAEDIRLLDWNETLLEQARHSLDKSRELAQRYGLEALLPNILHLSALVYWYLGRVRNDSSLLNRGRELNRAAHEKSKQVGDIQYAIASLLADVEWDYEISDYDQMESYAKELDKYEFKPYPLYFGRMRRIEADIAFYHGELEKAFSKYALGLNLIHQHGGFGRYAIERELLRLENKMIKLSTEEFKKWADYLHQTWLKIDEQDTHLLRTWSEQQILRADMSTIEW